MAIWSTTSFRHIPNDLRIDAEYYDPEYLRNAKIFKARESQPLSSVAHVSDGNHLAISETFSPNGVRYLRGQDLTDFFIADDSPVYIPKEQYQLLARSHIFPGDVLVGIVGTIGTVSLVTDRFPQLTANCKVAILRPRSLRSEYLAAFLVSRIGQGELKRTVRGSVQTGIILPDLRHLQIPTPTQDTQVRVTRLIRAAFKQRQKAILSYDSAREGLLDEIGLGNIRFVDQLTEITDYSEVDNGRRMDAEFFQPKYHRLKRRIDMACREFSGAMIEQLSEPLKYGTSERLDYVDKGVPFLRIADLQNKRFDAQTVLRISEHASRNVIAASVRTGDVLISRSGTLGVAVPIPPELDGAIYGSYFIRIRPNRELVDPEYLALFLNSECGALQVERLTTGGIQTNLTIPAINQIQVVLGSLSWQQRFVKRVTRALEARRLSNALITEAASTVESSVGVR